MKKTDFLLKRSQDRAKRKKYSRTTSISKKE